MKHTESSKELMAEKRRQWHRNHPGSLAGIPRSEEVKNRIRATHQKRNEIINQQKETEMKSNTNNVVNGRIVTREEMMRLTPEAGRADLLNWIDNEGMNHIPQIRIMRDERDKWRTGVSQALLARAGYVDIDRNNEFQCHTLKDIMNECLRNVGVDLKSNDINQGDFLRNSTRAFSTSDFQSVVAEVSGKSMLAGFDAVPTTFDLWTRAIDVKDFREQTLVGLSEFAHIPKLPEGGKIQAATAEDYQETFHLDTYSATFPITQMALINDDVGVLTAVPYKLGEAAKTTLNDAVYMKLAANPVMADGQTLFCTQHSNVTLPETLNAAMIDVIRATMALQKDQNNVRVRITPDVILCPVGLQGTLASIMSSQYVPNSRGQVTEVNPVQGLAEIISDPILDDLNPKSFYAVCTRYPGIIVAYLKSANRQPAISQTNSRLFDGIEYKVTFDFGICAANHRSLFKGILS